ncbi:MAG: hypothetical protein ACD_11C00115G0015 [uncultured bacterium]|nr:MAG: hypothetical protein ACD_11C00115G0015 [uncultured bacterium]HBR72106.1 hypothetical protein [Candidatus Moranbacteria bacterium]
MKKINTKIELNYEDKKRLLEYEIRMFRQTCEEFCGFSSKSQFEKNLLIESLAIHSRVLIDFFYGEKKKGGLYMNDLHAQDFMPDGVEWKKERSSQPQLFVDIKDKADKQLAHLSAWRAEFQRNGQNGWSANKILLEMEKVIQKFDRIFDIQNS